MSDSLAFDKTALLRLSFKGLDEHELQHMADLTELCTYPAGHVLCREGEYEDFFYVIVDGSVVISKKVDEGQEERILRESGRGDLVGEMALIQNAPRAATVRVQADCTVLQMEKKDFEAILSHSPHMAMDIIRITLDRMRANDRTAIAELQKTNKVLQQLNRNKLEFIQVAAHELRTPLTVLKGYVNVLRSLPILKDNPSLANVVDGILNGADRMHEVVSLMLDVSRIDIEDIKIAAVPVFVYRMVDDLSRTLAKSAAERGIELVIQNAPDSPVIHADPVFIQKALYHLVVNAIKYTPDGGKVYVSTRPIQIDEHTPGIEVMVRDTGVGLDAEHHDLIFEKFYQVGSVAMHSSGKTTFKGGGPGLGLAIVRGVARAHGGKVWVESKGHDETSFPGSTFYLRLPVNPPGMTPSTA